MQEGRLHRHERCLQTQANRQAPPSPAPSRVNRVGTTGRTPSISNVAIAIHSAYGLFVLRWAESQRPRPHITFSRGLTQPRPVLLYSTESFSHVRLADARCAVSRGPQAVGSYDARNSVVPTTGMPSRRYLMPLFAIRKPLLAPIECLWERRRL
jgi:hypothetical protein